MLFSLLLSLLLSALGSASSSTSRPDAYSLCDAQCLEAYQTSHNSERKLWATPNFSDDRFYDTPANATRAKPGDLLRWEDVSTERMSTNFTGIPGGLSVSRMIYMTEDIDRKPITASAYILLPYSLEIYGDLGATRFRTLAWAHGTVGHSRQCAPSNNQNLAYGWKAPIFFANSGYAVIATDYAGLGTQVPGGFRYEGGFLHAADVAYSVIAARKVIGHLLTDEWAVVGHSEGGLTAWRTNERLAMPNQDELLKAGTFLGAVSVAPALRPSELLRKAFAGDGPIYAPVSVYVMKSIQGLYPELQIKDWLTPEARELMPLLEQSCLSAGLALYSKLTAKQVFTNTTWIDSPAFRDWESRVNGAGPHALAAPMLVVQGLDDQITYTEEFTRDFKRTCDAFPESSAELLLVPELGHDPALYAAQPYYLAYIQRLFAGTCQQRRCSIRTIKPITKHFQQYFVGY
ncbi:secretory lipase [Microdochium trichocladiopsis]|uniref:Secretory lipase n=1 Tax=Microdochium trichocladiopsis TaxID=1682393 RepID=A0A9P8XPY0_9PEZI|nr:secretory lipase [Microdochium trichocladiopsis]KAH7010660.1 secretory lipase [Microdochium trichocladiopsis]